MASKDFYNTYDMQNKADIIAAGKRYGINEKDYYGFGGRWNDRDSDKYKGDYNDFKDAIKEAANRDYSTRRTLEAKALSGDDESRKRAEKGFGTIKSVVDTHETFKKDHEARGNNPDDFYSASDWAQLTHSAVTKDRTKQEEKLASKAFLDEKLNALKDSFKDKEASTPTPTEYVESDSLKAAKDRLAGKKADQTNNNQSVFKTDASTKKPATTSAKTNDQGANVASYLAQYKVDLAKGAGLKEDKENNINNAISAVAGM